MPTTAPPALTRVHDTPDGDHTVTTPDAATHVVVDHTRDRAHIDAPDALDAAQLTDHIHACRAALIAMQGRPDRRAALDAHIEREARRVADDWTATQVASHLQFAQWQGRDDLETRIWDRAQQLHALIASPDVQVTVEHLSRGGHDTLTVLELVDHGDLEWGASTEDGPRLWYRGDSGEPRGGGCCGQDELDAVADLKHDELIEPYVLRTTARGWAVVRAAVRGGLRLVDGA